MLPCGNARTEIALKERTQKGGSTERPSSDGCGSAELIVITSNNIDGTNPSSVNPYKDGMVVGAGVSQTGTLGIRYNEAGLNGGNGKDVFSARGWNSNSFNPDDFFSFVIAPISGGTIKFQEFTYHASLGDEGPQHFELRYRDYQTQSNFTNISSFGRDNLNPTFDISNISTSGTIEFRIYGWGAKNSGDISEFSINDYSFSGFTTAVPEPTSLLLTGMAVGGLALRRRRS